MDVMRIYHLISALIFNVIFFNNLIVAQEQEGMISLKTATETKLGYFIFQAEPGETIDMAFTLSNSSKEYPGSATLFVADAETAKGGGIAITSPTEAKRIKAGSWFDFEEQLIELNPGEKRNINLTLTVPEDTRSGDHIANVVLYKYIKTNDDDKTNDDQGTKVIVNRAYAQSIAVLIQIPGEVIHRLTVDSVTPQWTGSDLFLNVKFTNHGNVYEKSSGEIAIKQNGEIVFETNAAMNSIYPETSGILSVPVPSEFRSTGEFEVDIAWDYPGGKIEKDLQYTLEEKRVKEAKQVQKEDVKQSTEGLFILTEEEVKKYVFIAVLSLGVLLLIITLIILKLRKK
jgi:hypothetical protein